MNKKLLATLFASSVLLTACSSEKSENNTSSSTSSQNTESNKSTENKKEAFDFLAKNVDGEDVKLSDFKGKKVYINVWASWCGPCIREIPELEQVYQKLKDRDDFVFLSMTSPSDEAFGNMRPADETKKVILDKANELGATYPVLFDVNDRFMINYSVRAFPTHIFINSDGTINSQYPGGLTAELLEEHINKLS